MTWIRPADPADAVAIGRIMLRAFRDAPSAPYEAEELGEDVEGLGRDLLRSARSDGHLMLVTEVGATPVAVARVAPRDLARSHHIAQVVLCVDPEWRGRGVGEATLRAAEERAFSELRVERLELRIASNDEALLALARRGGYRCERTERGALFTAGSAKDLFFYVLDR
ncbi:MAG: GNAT family N-acetyltransferase [Deltaproteobacteria bacterium]|nr:MAG: GNAT family N-acetyltransferase [Deltaproteobacteria bacterium]